VDDWDHNIYVLGGDVSALGGCIESSKYKVCEKKEKYRKKNYKKEIQKKITKNKNENEKITKKYSNYETITFLCLVVMFRLLAQLEE
jgi:hypothetical protein